MSDDQNIDYYVLSEHNTATCFDHYVVAFRSPKYMKYKNTILISRAKKRHNYLHKISQYHIKYRIF